MKYHGRRNYGPPLFLELLKVPYFKSGVDVCFSYLQEFKLCNVLNFRFIPLHFPGSSSFIKHRVSWAVNRLCLWSTEPYFALIIMIFLFDGPLEISFLISAIKITNELSRSVLFAHYHIIRSMFFLVLKGMPFETIVITWWHKDDDYINTMVIIMFLTVIIIIINGVGFV